MNHDTWCDGYTVSHNIEITFDRSGGVRRLLCPQCGAVTPWVGGDISDAELRRMPTCTPQWTACTGQCV